MNSQYHPDRYKKLRNMILFAIVISLIVFGFVFFLFFGNGEIYVLSRTPQISQLPGIMLNETKICGDECFKQLALTNANFSYCKNVSEAEKDECLEMFMNTEREACLAIRSYELRKKCINTFAYAEKNLSLCDFLKSSDSALCKEKINPPCMDVSEQEKRELCLALRNNKSSYCTKLDCFLSYANERKDSSVCEALDAKAENYACKSIASKTDKCAALSGIYTLDYCYQLFVQYSHEFSYCEKIQTGFYKFECYLNVAIIKKNKDYCAKNELEYIWKCYTNYSLASADIEGCLAINNYATGSKDGCIRTYAIKYDEPKICLYASTSYIRTNCYADVILQSTNLTVAKCETVLHPTWKDKCFTRAATIIGDKSICDYIENPDEKRRCGEIF